MFSRENRKFLIVFTLIGFVSFFTIAGAVYLIQHDKQAATVWTIGGGIITALLTFVRAEMRHREAKSDRVVIGEAVLETKDKVNEIEKKTNGNLTRAVHEVAEEVRKAAHEPAPGMEAMPRTRHELNQTLKVFAHAICDDLAHQAALKAARQAAEAVDSAVRDVAQDAARIAAEHAARRVVEDLRRSGALILPMDKMEVIPGETKPNADAGGGI